MDDKKIAWFKLFLNDTCFILPELDEVESPEELKEERARTAFEIGAALLNAIAKEKGEPLPFKMTRSTRLIYQNFNSCIDKARQESHRNSENGKKGGAPAGNQNARKVIDIKRQIDEARENSGGFVKGL